MLLYFTKLFSVIHAEQMPDKMYARGLHLVTAQQL
jgi:hypothetical protein